MKTHAYNIELHKHRLAAWAASRAASVKGCRFKVQHGVAILETSGFNPAFLTSSLPGSDGVDVKHTEWRKNVIAAAERNDLVFSHGVAAKLINCYLKVRFVCGGQHDQESVKHLHPPIDDLLLKALAKCNFGGEAKQWRKFRQKRWSKFDSETYENAINLIRQKLSGAPLWKIEAHWKGHR